MTDDNRYPVIGIGASAGGLEPLEVFFSKVKQDSGFSFVVIQHLAPNHKSLMDELLARHTTLPIEVITDGMELLPNHIYLNPPKMFVELEGNRFALSEKADRNLSFPISTFFQSLADTFEEEAVAIVLSGTGSDGSEGIKSVKERGGLVIAQDPVSAKFDGMPKSAIQSGAVDKIISVEQMPDELEQFFASRKQVKIETGGKQIDHHQLNSLLAVVRQHTGVDFTGYKWSTVLRRTNRRMGLVGFHNLTDYENELKENSAEAQHLAKELLIGVTRFFRDEEAFAALKNKVIPKLIDENSDRNSLRVWVPACSSGEEAYSIAILILDHLRRNSLDYSVTIFATDLDQEAIKLAANRVFPDSISNEVPSHLLGTYFVPQRKGYMVTQEVRDMIVFSVHNLVQDPPFSRIDLLSCRNFLIYLNPEVQQRLFSLFQYTLRPNGYLFLGASESLGEMSDQFYELDKRNKIYVNKFNRTTVQQLRSPNLRLGPLGVGFSGHDGIESQRDRSSGNGKRRLINDVQEHLIQEYVPDTLVFNDRFELIHTTGDVNRWLRLPKGEVSIQVIRMLPEHIRLTFELMANRVMSTGEAVLINNHTLEGQMKEVYGDSGDFIQIRIARLPSSNGQQLLAATFKVSDATIEQKPVKVLDLNMASQEKIGILERELRINKEHLQTTIEELESSNEELQAANEELQSSNEELESVNEELYTVNSEYQEKVVELTDTNNDLNNLIQHTDVAILFLDSHLHIRRFTPPIKKIMNLMPQDMGRHISHFRSRFEVEDFMEHVERVFDQLRPYETVIKNLSGRDYIMRISPFLTVSKEVQGVLITFVDVTDYSRTRKELKLSNDALEKLNVQYGKQTELFELITTNSIDMISVHSLEGGFEFVSPAAYELTGYTVEKLSKRKPLDLIPFEEDKIAWSKAFEDLRYGQRVGRITYRFKTKDRKLKWFETSLRQMNESSGKVSKILATTRDVTQRIRYEEELSRLSIIAKQTAHAVITTDLEGRITFVNRAFEVMTGFAESEVMGLKPGSFLQGKETDQDNVRVMRTAVANLKPFEVDVINYTKGGEKYWVRIHSEPMQDRDGNVFGFFSFQHEISQQKDYENHIDRLNSLLNHQNKRLKESNAALEDFAYVASHDLKAPLRNISGIIGLIRKKGPAVTEQKMEKMLGIIYNATQEMNRLVESLLHYARSGVVNEELQEIDFLELAKEIEFMFAEQLKDIGGTITVKSPKCKIWVYPILFKRMVVNLVSNAIKYRSERPLQLHITCKDGKDKFKVEVADNGIGIAPQHRQEIFRHFRRLNQREDSNGIGLAVCKKIAELHGGNIYVDGEVGKGSTFSVVIPTLHGELMVNKSAIF